MTALLVMAAAFLFILPAYHGLKAKAYDPRPFVSSTIVLCALALALGAKYPAANAVVLAVAGGLLLLVTLLRPRPGAPGEAYLKIGFPCPECGRPVEFPRDREGCAELCPECGELICVPAGLAAGAAPAASRPRRRGGSADPVPVGRFLRPETAELAREKLEAGGVEAFVADAVTANVQPGIHWAAGGVRLMVRAADAERAREILDRPPEETELPDDFVPPPAPPEPESGPGFGGLLLSALSFLFIAPFALVRLWAWAARALFPSAARRGTIPGSISFRVAFGLAAAAVAAAALAFRRAAERGRPGPPAPGDGE
jgi:hypothetical protein